ncbi:MAG: gluconate 2-dehydrogenase subunit 3 family protein [Cypionkella sp.]
MAQNPLKPTRRGFLATAAAGTAIAASGRNTWAQTPLPPLAQYAPLFLLPAEWAFVMAATARLIPSDDGSPGAIEARVPVFIDLQLAGDFGQAADWYMTAPHVPDSDPLLGFQSPSPPAQIYRDGIAAFDAWCVKTHGAAFASLDAAIQDAALTALEAGDVKLPPELRDFFDLLVQNTKEGFFADPMYGGNAGMVGWLHIGFPGARASYREWNDPATDNVAYPMGPVSISGERA